MSRTTTAARRAAARNTAALREIADRPAAVAVSPADMSDAELQQRLFFAFQMGVTGAELDAVRAEQNRRDAIHDARANAQMVAV